MLIVIRNLCVPTVDWVLGTKLSPRSSIIDRAELVSDKECEFPLPSPVQCTLSVRCSHLLAPQRTPLPRKMLDAINVPILVIQVGRFSNQLMETQ